MILVSLALTAALAGCGGQVQEADRLFRTDTVVNIPLNPATTAPTQPAETVPEETVPPTEETVAETVKPSSGSGSTKSSSKSSSSSTKSSSSSTKSSASSTKNSSSVKASEAATQPPATEAPVTEPPETLPPETDPPETQSPEAAIYEISDYSPGSLEYAVAEQINACRADAGLEPLAMNGWLCGVASVRAYEVSVSWSHTRPNGSGWQTVLSDYGCGYSAAAEELVHASGYDAAAIVGKWMSAESNSADLLSPDYTTIGVGIYTQDGTTFLAAILMG